MKKEESVSQGENGINNTQNKLTDLNVINDANITISKSDSDNVTIISCFFVIY